MAAAFAGPGYLVAFGYMDPGSPIGVAACPNWPWHVDFRLILG
jgi:hypothetical protein